MGRRVTSKPVRVYSLETKKSLNLAFARIYVNHLVPALFKKRMVMAAKRASSTMPATRDDSTNHENGDDEFAKSVRFEVDMALALSAKGFGWSRALEAKLALQSFSSSSSHHQTTSFRNRPFTTLGMKTTAIVEKRAFASQGLVLPHNASAWRNPKCDLKTMKKSSCLNGRIRVGSRKVPRSKKSEDDAVKDKVARLRTLLPGGSEMELGNEQALLAEVSSYITCLKLQVKVLQCLVEGHDDD